MLLERVAELPLVLPERVVVELLFVLRDVVVVVASLVVVLRVGAAVDVEVDVFRVGFAVVAFPLVDGFAVLLEAEELVVLDVVVALLSLLADLEVVRAVVVVVVSFVASCSRRTSRALYTRGEEVLLVAAVLSERRLAVRVTNA